MTSGIINPYEAVVLPMLVGPKSALKLKQVPPKLKSLLTFIVTKMMDEERLAYEMAEVVVLAAIMGMENHEAKKKALASFLGTPMVIEAFLLQGRPSPYVQDQEHILPRWMDERLLGLIPVTLVGKDGPMWDEKSKAQVHYVAQLLWNQDLLHAKKNGVWMTMEHFRLVKEFNKANRASTTSTTPTKS